jgi:hypothetical protein
VDPMKPTRLARDCACGGAFNFDFHNLPLASLSLATSKANAQSFLTYLLLPLESNSLLSSCSSSSEDHEAFSIRIDLAAAHVHFAQDCN